MQTEELCELAMSITGNVICVPHSAKRNAWHWHPIPGLSPRQPDLMIAGGLVRAGNLQDVSFFHCISFVVGYSEIFLIVAILWLQVFVCLGIF